jgi:hypothetical protein
MRSSDLLQWCARASSTVLEPLCYQLLNGMSSNAQNLMELSVFLSKPKNKGKHKKNKSSYYNETKRLTNVN